MNSMTMTTTQRAQLALLVAHFSRRGLLSGTDLLTGHSYKSIYPLDLEDFFQAHLLGPGRRRKPAEVVARDHHGKLHQFNSFFRSQVAPRDKDGMTSTISVSLTGQLGLEPTAEVRSVVEHLQAAGWPVIVERSFRLLRWVLWTLFDEPVQEVRARDHAFRQYAEIRDRNLVGPQHVEVPLIDESADQPHLPHQFFSGEFFGTLYELNGGKLHPLDLSAVKHFRPSDGEIVFVSFVDDERQRTLDAMLTAWGKTFGGRRIRAGELLAVLENEGVSIDSLVPPGDVHRRTIELGQHLRSVVDQVIGRRKVHSHRSGHGTTFWLVEVNDVCEEDALTADDGQTP